MNIEDQRCEEQAIDGMIAAARTKGIRDERDRVCRVFDFHLAGIAVDDDTRRKINALVKDLASGADPSRPV
jgi:hypothetical protein